MENRKVHFIGESKRGENCELEYYNCLVTVEMILNLQLNARKTLHNNKHTIDYQQDKHTVAEHQETLNI